MAKYDVKYSCGHKAVVELCGKGEDRRRKIKWMEECGLCPECYKTHKEKEYAETKVKIRVKYGEYKERYENERFAIKGEYDAETKTIEVYLPKENAEQIITAFANLDEAKPNISKPSYKQITEELIQAIDNAQSYSILLKNEKFPQNTTVEKFIEFGKLLDSTRKEG